MERLTAHKCRLADLAAGEYVVRSGLDPNHVATPRGPVSRANVIAAVVEKPGANSVVLDDGTARMEARSFETPSVFENILVGDIVLLIARPREYEGRRYLAAEIAKRLGDVTWLRLRDAELGRAEPIPQPAKVAARPAPQEPVVGGTMDGLIAVIKELDTGSGAAIEDVVAKAGPQSEEMLTNLMAEGEIFELKPGRVKVLE